MPAPRKTTSSNFGNQRALATACVANDTLTRIASRWKMQILFFIHSGACSFGALKRSLPSVSDHVLATRLRELTGEGLADKHATSQRRHEYRVTPRGARLLDIVAQLCDWERADPA